MSQPSQTSMQMEFLLDMQIGFKKALEERDWNEVSKILYDLSEYGYGDEEIKLSKTMTDEEVVEYKRWDERVNGSIETQMDDNS